MSEDLNLEQSPASTAEVGNASPEHLQQVYRQFVELIEARGFPANVVQVLKETILPRIQLEEGSDGPSYFKNLYYLGEGAEGDTKLILTESQIFSRANKLNGLVPPGTEKQLALVWLVGHELGHALETAYGIAEKRPHTGAFEGLYDYPNPMQEYLKARPGERWSQNPEDSDRIDRERACEGLAQELLAHEMLKLGMDNRQIILALHQAYEQQRKRAELLKPLLEQTSESVPLRDIYDGRLGPSGRPDIDGPLAVLAFGYAYPMSIDEAQRRYAAVIQR